VTPAHADLYRRLLAFDFDEPGQALSFAARLAREQGWPSALARRAVVEYLRFVFLARVAGRPVCPSEQIDQVWHLHLTHTRSYWDRLCGEVLGTPLHHDPSRGGPDEAAKHWRMYADTLDAYREHFGAEPPADLWPAPDVRFGDDLHSRRVNLRRNWVVPKQVVSRVGLVALAVAAVAAATGCVGQVGFRNPFDLSGPEFLGVYGIAAVVAVVAGLVFRRLARDVPADESEPASLADPFALAYLAGGRVRVADAAVFRLVRDGHLRVTAEKDRLAFVNVPDVSSPVEQAVLAAARSAGARGETALNVRIAARQAAEQAAAGLRQDGLVLRPEERARASVAGFAPTLAVALFLGVPKVFIGLGRERPVAFLVILLVASLLAACFVASVPFRSLAGDRVLAGLRRRHARLERGGQAAPPAAEALLGLALFGPVALGAESAALRQLLAPPGGGGGDGGDAGGGGDGGGGGCGGGCGGCGGGGGD
jgi:uncharacterized protein (TIGR04222 family)